MFVQYSIQYFMKSKKVTALLALFFGMLGVHRFYLGKKFLGIVYLFLFAFTMTVTIEEGVPLIIASALLGFIDFLLFAVMPIEDFDEKYNKKYLYEDYNRSTYHESFEQYSGKRRPSASKFDTYKAQGIEAFRAYEFDEAICFFEEALNERPNAPAIQFNLACCFSMIEDSNAAFSFLELAVQNGFDMTEKIHTHDALAHLRTQPEFDSFVENGYQIQQPLSIETKKDDLLTQLSKLGELKEKGLLSEDEFVLQKKKLLG